MAILNNAHKVLNCLNKKLVKVEFSTTNENTADLYFDGGNVITAHINYAKVKKLK